MKLFIRYIGPINQDLDDALSEILSIFDLTCTGVRHDEERFRELDFETFQDLKENGTVTIH